ncbi:hypothetical protein [Ferroacidibacillus organovorans]|uniref:Uncharacterized protein n=2 Tax=Ferroacidibacillus organovorans TaxID=1765683 RepID=A0A101XTG4_9BACL|nr:hypothetical protein [Ferroacidibacillus organovorans]KUO97269.1 hypothetical protein ATW55_11810 [Ferroacidibacillus organovorans]KYP81987.1 hypothetical protein AYJ22_15680 [Ferroacidibacillus organovorans]OPG17088.1 hypothetical protein B2M26_03205 [Ferroacidibacillus organovorans]
MPSNLITTFFAICVSFSVLVILVLAPSLVGMKMQMDGIAADAARVYAITGSMSDAQNELSADLSAMNLPTTYNGQTLITVSAVPSGSGQTGVSATSTPTSANASLSVNYHAPIPFDRALTLFGGSALPMTTPMTAVATQWNEVQYTGVGP